MIKLDKDLYTASDVAQMLDITPLHFRAMIREKKVKAGKLGKQYVITKADVETILTERGIVWEK